MVEALGIPAKIVLADKNPLVVAGVSQLVMQSGKYEIVACVSNGRAFLDQVREVAFDVGVIGWEMPIVDGKAILEEMRELQVARPIIVYTGTSGKALPRQIMELGGAGFVSKSAPPEELLRTIDQVLNKRMVFPFLDVHRINRESINTLTRRERDMLAALASGASNAELADKFEVTLHTIKFHLKNLYMKLEVANRTQAAILYMKSVNQRD